MPFNVFPLVNTCHALGFSAFLMLSTWFDSNRSGSRVRFYS